MNFDQLRKDWIAFQQANPRVRIRDAATSLGVSEAELLTTQIGETVTRLRPAWYDMLPKLEGLGEVMALTRNEVFVHEKVGHYRHISVNTGHKMGQVLDKNIDSRIFFRNWSHGFAVSQIKDGKQKYSLQFFDQYGDAVHKIHLRPASNLESYKAFVEMYKHKDQRISIEVQERNEGKSELPDSEVDQAGLQQAWDNLKDTHDFIFMLRDFKVSREQAFRIAGTDYAWQVDNAALSQVLERAAAQSLQLMIFVNNPGCIQIHSGQVHRLKGTEEWYNVLDPDFNLHVKYKEIASTWVVKKPVDTGDVHSLECFDAAGNVLSYVFGKRHEGEHENQSWRDIITSIA